MQKNKKTLISIIISLVIIIALAVTFTVLLINANKKITTANRKNNDFTKQIESYKNTVAQKESELSSLNSQNKNSSDEIKDYKNKLSKKDKEIKKLNDKIAKLNKSLNIKKERESKVATVGEYTDSSGHISLVVQSAKVNNISFEYTFTYESDYVAGFSCDNVSLSGGKGSFTYDNIDEKGNGTIEVIDSKTIRYYVNCTMNETPRGYSSACDATTLHLITN